MFPLKHRAFHLLVFASICAVLLTGLVRTPALAKLVSCRSDPVVVLSDGTIVDVSADIETLPFRVTEVHYTLHIPEGLTPILIIHTPTWLTTTETFTIFSDMPPNRYSSETTVSTVSSNIGVTARMLVNLGTGKAQGFSGQALRIELADNQLLSW